MSELNLSGTNDQTLPQIPLFHTLAYDIDNVMSVFLITYTSYYSACEE